MKKVLCVLFAIMMVAALCLSVSAAGTLNENEKAVLAKLNSTETLGKNGAKFMIPKAYVTSAENYFLTIEMTAEQKTAIIAELDKAIVVVREEAKDYAGTGTYELKTMSQKARSAVLKAGQAACKQVGATLVYDAKTNKVVITKDADGTVLFSNEAIVKTTGEAFTVNAAVVAVVIAVAVVGTTAALFVTAKKKGLLAR